MKSVGIVVRLKKHLKLMGAALSCLLFVFSNIAIADEPANYGRSIGYLATPEMQPGKLYPAVIVVHEWWGLNQWVKDQTERLANAGYIALAIDLYDGEVFSRKEKAAAKKRLQSLSTKRSMGDVYQAVRFLSKFKAASGNIGIVGWGMGGGIAMEAALRFTDLKAAVVNYGTPETDANRIATLEVPILAIFGREDDAISQRTIKEFDKKLTAATKPHIIKVYPKVGHAFMNDENKAGFDDSSTKLAWREIATFLSNNLR